MSKDNISKVLLGIVYVVVMHIIFLFIIILLMTIIYYLNTVFNDVDINTVGRFFVIAIFTIGATQLLYIIPTMIYLRRRQEWGLFKGVIIGAVITALLNGGCWLLVTSREIV